MYTILYFVLGLLFLIFNQQITLIICYILGAVLLLGRSGAGGVLLGQSS